MSLLALSTSNRDENGGEDHPLSYMPSSTTFSSELSSPVMGSAHHFRSTKSFSERYFKPIMMISVAVLFILMLISINTLHKQTSTLAHLVPSSDKQVVTTIPTQPSNNQLTPPKTSDTKTQVSTTTPTTDSTTAVSVGKTKLLSLTSRFVQYQEDVVTLANHFGFSFDSISFNALVGLPIDKRDYGFMFDRLQETGMMAALCNAYDIIVVSDALWYSLPFIRQSQLCAKKMIFFSFNQFDAYLQVDEKNGVDQPRVWRDILNQALRDFNWHYPVIVQSTPFQGYYMSRFGVESPRQEHKEKTPPPPRDVFPMIRHFGPTFDASARRGDRSKTPKCFFYADPAHDSADRDVLDLAIQGGLSLTCKTFTNLANAPETNPYWYMPSTLYMTSNEAGVVSLIPSIPLWLEIYAQIPEYDDIKNAIDIMESDNHMKHSEMAKYLDAWSPAYEPCIVQFNSWTELETIITTQSWRSKEEQCRESSHVVREAQFGLWHQLFQERFPHISRNPITESERQAVQKLYNIKL